MAIVGVLTTILSGNNAPLMASLAQSEAAMKGYASGTTASTALAKTALLGVGVGAAVGVVMAVKAAADFEDAFAGVRKTVDEADLTAAGMSFDSLALVFRNMATEIPVAATELAAIGETAGALGINARDIEAFTRTVALLGSTTDLSTAQAAESLGKVGTILGLTGGEYLAFADILVNLGNKGASTESEIIEITKRFASAGMQAGLTTPQILAFSSAIASAGVEPEAAGSSLSRLFGNIVKGAANATGAGKAFAKTTGMAFGDFSDLVKTDTVGAMLLVLKSLQGLDKFGQQQALGAMGITAVRDVNAIRALAATYDTNLVPALKNAGAASGALATEAEKRFDTFNVKLQLFGNNVNELAIKLGTALLPGATAFVEQLTGVVQKLEGTIGRVIELYNSLPAVLREPININPEELNPVKPQAPGLGVKPGLTDVVGQALGIIPQGVFSGQKPWGSFGTPGFGAGEVGSPFFGPSTPALGINNATGFRTPTQITNQITVKVGEDKLAEWVERKFYNDQTVANSGFSTDERPRH